MIRYINIFFFAVMIVMNYLVNALPLNGKTTGANTSAYHKWPEVFLCGEYLSVYNHLVRY